MSLGAGTCCSAATPPEKAARMKLPPAHVEPASDMADVPISRAGQNGWIGYLWIVACTDT